MTGPAQGTGPGGTVGRAWKEAQLTCLPGHSWSLRSGNCPCPEREWDQGRGGALRGGPGSAPSTEETMGEVKWAVWFQNPRGSDPNGRTMNDTASLGLRTDVGVRRPWATVWRGRTDTTPKRGRHPGDGRGRQGRQDKRWACASEESGRRSRCGRTWASEGRGQRATRQAWEAGGIRARGTWVSWDSYSARKSCSKSQCQTTSRLQGSGSTTGAAEGRRGSGKSPWKRQDREGGSNCRGHCSRIPSPQPGRHCGACGPNAASAGCPACAGQAPRVRAPGNTPVRPLPGTDRSLTQLSDTAQGTTCPAPAPGVLPWDWAPALTAVTCSMTRPLTGSCPFPCRMFPATATHISHVDLNH